MGRPTKLTPEVQEKIVELIKAGNYANAICSAAGIWPNTFTNWMNRGEEEKSGKYRNFYLAVKEAEDSCEVACVAVIRTAIDAGDWRAAIALLERRFPERWRPSAHIEIEDNSPVQFVVEYGGRNFLSFEEARQAEIKDRQDSAYPRRHVN